MEIHNASHPKIGLSETCADCEGGHALRLAPRPGHYQAMYPIEPDENGRVSTSEPTKEGACRGLRRILLEQVDRDTSLGRRWKKELGWAP